MPLFTRGISIEISFTTLNIYSIQIKRWLHEKPPSILTTFTIGICTVDYCSIQVMSSFYKSVGRIGNPTYTLTPNNLSIACCARDAAAFSTPWLRSGGCVRASHQKNCSLLRACGLFHLSAQSAIPILRVRGQKVR